jgi:hypothetical protein
MDELKRKGLLPPQTEWHTVSADSVREEHKDRVQDDIDRFIPNAELMERKLQFGYTARPLMLISFFTVDQDDPIGYCLVSPQNYTSKRETLDEVREAGISPPSYDSADAVLVEYEDRLQLPDGIMNRPISPMELKTIPVLLKHVN